jgi:hydroxypyruvate isomerase
MRLAANLSLMFTELPLPERFAAAARAGFDGAEIQFPYDHPADVLADAARAAGLPVVLINVPAGDLAGGEVGIGALPGREAEFRDGVERCAAYARALGAAKANVLAGRPGPDADPGACMATLAANLRRAADRLGPLGVRVMAEPVNPFDVPGFFLASLDAGLAALDRAGHQGVALQFDLYHMARTEPDLPAAVLRAGGRIGHVQFADHPGRHEPGTGRVDFRAALCALARAGYDGWVSAEYRPAGRTEDGLAWMPGFRDAMRAAEEDARR